MSQHEIDLTGDDNPQPMQQHHHQQVDSDLQEAIRQSQEEQQRMDRLKKTQEKEEEDKFQKILAQFAKEEDAQQKIQKEAKQKALRETPVAPHQPGTVDQMKVILLRSRVSQMLDNVKRQVNDCHYSITQVESVTENNPQAWNDCQRLLYALRSSEMKSGKDYAHKIINLLFLFSGGRKQFEGDGIHDDGSKKRKTTRSNDNNSSSSSSSSSSAPKVKVQEKAQYGSVYPDLASEIYSTANLKSNEYFIDIGSGIGQAVIQASIEYPNVHAFGLELLENRHNHALSLQSKVYAIIMKYLYLFDLQQLLEKKEQSYWNDETLDDMEKKIEKWTSDKETWKKEVSRDVFLHGSFTKFNHMDNTEDNWSKKYIELPDLMPNGLVSEFKVKVKGQEVEKNLSLTSSSTSSSSTSSTSSSSSSPVSLNLPSSSSSSSSSSSLLSTTLQPQQAYYLHSSNLVKKELVKIIKKHSVAEGGGYTILFPSTNRERNTNENKLEFIDVPLSISSSSSSSSSFPPSSPSSSSSSSSLSTSSTKRSVTPPSTLMNPTKCISPIDLIRIGDVFFLNNALDTMGSRNGTGVNILGNFCELCRFMKVGARLITVDPLLLFETNNWTNQITKQDEHWMKEERITLKGAVSWNRGDVKNHDWYLYTKVRDDWCCNACTLLNNLKCDSDNTTVMECEFIEGHQGKDQVKRTSKRKRSAIQ